MSSFVPATLPAGLVEPGVYAQIRTDGDPGLSAPDNRVLLWGYVKSGNYAINQPVRAVNLEAVVAGAGATSMLAHAYQAAKAQIAVGAECWLMPLAEPGGGTAQVVSVTFTGEPTAGVLSSASAAAAADAVSVLYRGRGVRVGIKANDTWETIATNVKTAWDILDDAPATCTRSTATLSFTSPHVGAYDNGAIEISFESRGASGCAATFGTMAVSGTAGAAGSVSIATGSKTITYSVGNSDTAATTGTGLVNKINSDSFAIRAAQPSSPTGTVTLFYVNGRPLRPLSVSSTESGISPQAVADTVGTAGAGVPSLTSALANLAADDSAKFRAHGIFWTSVTEWSALATQIEAQDLAPYQKGGVAICALTGSLSALSTLSLATSTTPKLESSARYPVLWAQAAANAGFELAARLVAAIGALDVANIDRNWNGFEFVGTAAAPLVATHAADRPSTDDRNAAIYTYRHCPVTVNASGNLAMTWGGTSYKSRSTRDAKLTKLSVRICLDYFRSDIIAYLSGLFASKKMKLSSEPRTAKAVSLSSVENAVYRWMKRLDSVDLFDGADAHKDAVKAVVSVTPGRIDVNIPFVPLADLDVLAPVGIVE